MMQLLDQSNTADYLRSTGRIGPDEQVQVCELTGGVSNMVLRVMRPQFPGQDFVLKQARAQLRTAQPWYSRLERIWREADVLATCQRLLGAAGCDTGLPASTPRILFEDRSNYLFAMTAAAATCEVWKHPLLAGRIDDHVAIAAGHLLSALHGGSWRDTRCAELLGDRSLFDELRIAPYYRTLVAHHPESRIALASLIASLEANACCLVHADFSPKNMLIGPDGLLLVDFETGHFGDPAFDLGFFLSHLVLKACLNVPEHGPLLALTRTFEQAYCAGMSQAVSQTELDGIWSRGVRHFAACGWARLDGKSPVEYLSDEARRTAMRTLCQRVLDEPPRDWATVVALADHYFRI